MGALRTYPPGSSMQRGGGVCPSLYTQSTTNTHTHTAQYCKG